MAARDNERPETMRAANHDRERVAEALRVALDEGRLSLAEYDDRVGTAYGALTYADLNALLADLPASRDAMVLPTAKPLRVGDPQRPERRPRKRRRVPVAIMVLWTVWGGVVGINVAVWAIVSATVGRVIYPWPIWVAMPTGAALIAATIGVDAIRRRYHEPAE